MGGPAKQDNPNGLEDMRVAHGTQNTHPANLYLSRQIPLFAGVPLVAQIVRSFSRSSGGGEGVH